jgi:hypothetical protein
MTNCLEKYFGRKYLGKYLTNIGRKCVSKNVAENISKIWEQISITNCLEKYFTRKYFGNYLGTNIGRKCLKGLERNISKNVSDRSDEISEVISQKITRTIRGKNPENISVEKSIPRFPTFSNHFLQQNVARYDPFLQTRHRVEQLKQLGHDVDKVEFIVMGGTFMALPDDYRDYFIRNLHDALSGNTSVSVSEAVAFSEKSLTKCVGITIETRPDYCLKRHLSDMLAYGCTRLEIGVQSVYEDVARDTNRGHTVQAVSESFQLSKDAGFKVVAHMMPDLPNVGLERDVEQFIQFFEVRETES